MHWPPFRQPAFDGEFAAFLAAIAVFITLVIYGVSHYRAKARHERLRTAIRAFNALRSDDEKYGHRELGRHHITPITMNGIKRVLVNQKQTDFFMRLDASDTPCDVYAATGRLPHAQHFVRHAEKICMELLMLDASRTTIVASKIFVFYYINDSWETSMGCFFAAYQLCLMYYRLCDAWDTAHFAVLSSAFATPDAAAFSRQYALLRK